MSFSARTPESLLPRSDSKNPATTCRGITTTGRPCRKSLAASPQPSPNPSPVRGSGVLTVLQEEHAAAFFCHHHKDQAVQLLAQGRKQTTLHPLKEKSSIDTLLERVGVLEIDDNVAQPRRRRKPRAQKASSEHAITRRDSLPKGWNHLQSPLMSVPTDLVNPPPKSRIPSRPPRSNMKFSWSCCLRADSDSDDDRPARVPKSRFVGDLHSTGPNHRPNHGAGIQPSRVTPRPQYLSTQPQQSTSPSRPTKIEEQDASPVKTQTRSLLSYIPSTLSPQTTSLLLTELSRPISTADEAGYIYIFWLTPESGSAKPDDETASSLLDDDEDYRGGNEYGGLYPSLKSARAQAADQTLQRYASVRRTLNTVYRPSPRSGPDEHELTTRRTILLKIGRAANVHRRMSQWSKQCGQEITLIRYYPNTPSSPKAHQLSTSNDMIVGRKVPHVHRVERLVHLELAEKRVIKPECQACGREHREWFEIDASRDGLKSVNEVIKRWIRWAEAAR
ncbi:hypothetical protein PV10_05413 [Exophiala mesophila]|uniref:Bacteriophage T5 Orf172 DNA-binding domain-containing protein n=1 Tax=Exophiala mesophila TaxID=212818 RepID=A0A0D1Z9W3_EXOME|nr:uncharacterized protein PV10_05413 [Exophiala mesophila]KIV90804.1 hypothetical protein PV10_05413 [Exophiala mesophila]